MIAPLLMVYSPIYYMSELRGTDLPKVRTKNVRFQASESAGSVSGILKMPESASALYVLAHGAGAGMRHHFMETISDLLAKQGIATFRYQFPYTEAGRKRPDPAGILTSTVRNAVAKARAIGGGLPMFAGGKSMGGRMTSQAQASEPLAGVKGIAFLGFPLHAPGRHDALRADHLKNVKIPMLFLQGTRDSLADLELMRPMCKELGRRAKLHIVDGGDHSFKVLKRSGRHDDEVMDELAVTITTWVGKKVC
jgi:predicted alpha/beta-hydrolase family hydrolase